MNKRLACTAPLLIAALILPGCLGISSEKTYHSPPTTGQELSDLKTALDSGVISQEEYDQLRADIINGTRE